MPSFFCCICIPGWHSVATPYHVYGEETASVAIVPYARVHVTMKELDCKLSHAGLPTSVGTAGGFAARGGAIGDVYVGESVMNHDRRIQIPVLACPTCLFFCAFAPAAFMRAVKCDAANSGRAA